MVEGSITIETLLSTDKFDRQIAQLEKKIDKEENKKIKIEAELTDIRDQIAEWNELVAEVDKYKSEYDSLIRKSQETPFEVTDTERAKIKAYQEQLSYINSNKDAMKSLEQKGMDLLNKHKEINKNVAEYKTRIESIKIKKQKADIDSMKDSFKSVGNSIQDSIKKIGKMALAIFGIRTAISFLKSASSELASYDQQYATDLEYIRFVLTQAIAPILRAIVQLAMQLLGFINMIAQAWFGINLFGNASVEDFNQMKKGASGVSKEVKEIKKELAGFDEITRLTDEGETAGAGGTGITMPSMDLSEIQGETPEWMDWIAKNKDVILAVLTGVATALGLIKLGVKGIKALGIGVMIGGIVYAVQGLLKYLEDPTFQNLGQFITGIGIAIIGLGITIGSLPVAIAGVAVAIFGIVVMYWEDIKNFLRGGLDWLHGKSDWVREFFGDTIGDIYDGFVNVLEDVFNWFDTLFTNIKGVFDNVIKFITGVFEGDWSKAWDGLVGIVTGLFNIMVERIQLPLKILINWFNGIAEGVKSMFRNVVTSITDWFRNLANSLPDVIGRVLKGAINGLLGFVENIINKPVNALNGLIGIVNSVPGINIPRLSTVSFPRLAKGSILNAPGRGTLVGGQAIAGEAGREAYLPLSDHQLLEELGSTIGKYITINAEITNTMNGKVLSRELQRIQSETAFSYNG